MKFKVQTLDQPKLEAAAQELAKRAHADFEPNLFIGIRTGGYVVAELMDRSESTPLLPLTCRRPGTEKKKKSGLFKATLKNLPYFISNQLRIAEHIYLTGIKKPKPKMGYQPDKEEYDTIKSAIESLGKEARIFIIDDSLDSGATMKVIYDLVKDITHEEAIIKTGVITQTTEKPLFTPDFKLYDLTLCRFPWSFDFKDGAHG